MTVMNIYITYAIILVLLLALELLYFRIADKCNIIDKPNERSSHSTIVLRGGGIIFLLGLWIWAAFAWAGWLGTGSGFPYPWALAGVTLIAGVSFVDDVHSLPDSVRLVAQFVAMGLVLWQVCLVDGLSVIGDCGLIVKGLVFVMALIVFVGAADIYNFMDGINGITAGYSLSVLVPLMVVNGLRVEPAMTLSEPAMTLSEAAMTGGEPAMTGGAFISESLIVVTILAVLVFSFFNFRGKGKAKCFAGDVGSVGIAYILLFAIGMLIARTGDVTWLVLLLVYGVDGCLTICHRLMLHEHIGEAHRKHMYQLMSNELGMSHPVVALIYMGVQLAVSLGFVFICPLLSEACGISLVACHWIYLAAALVLLAVVYLLFMKKYYHLHEEYLASLREHKSLA